MAKYEIVVISKYKEVGFRFDNKNFVASLSYFEGAPTTISIDEIMPGNEKFVYEMLALGSFPWMFCEEVKEYEVSVIDSGLIIPMIEKFVDEYPEGGYDIQWGYEDIPNWI